MKRQLHARVLGDRNDRVEEVLEVRPEVCFGGARRGVWVGALAQVVVVARLERPAAVGDGVGGSQDTDRILRPHPAVDVDIQFSHVP